MSVGCKMTAEMKAGIIVVAAILLISAGAITAWKYKSNADKAETAEATVAIQESVISTQAIQAAALNSIAEDTGKANTVVKANSENAVIKYREILKVEKTCDIAVPSDVAFGLLDYANRLRSGAVSASPGIIDAASAGSITSGKLTYCQAVLWINPLLATIEQANNQLAAIRLAEQKRQETGK